MAGEAYEFKAELYFIKNDAKPLSDAFKIIKVKEGPIGGNLTVSPETSEFDDGIVYALYDELTLKAEGWYLRNDPSATLLY